MELRAKAWKWPWWTQEKLSTYFLPVRRGGEPICKAFSCPQELLDNEPILMLSFRNFYSNCVMSIPSPIHLKKCLQYNRLRESLLTRFSHLCSKQTSWGAHNDTGRIINLRGKQNVYTEDVHEGNEHSGMLKITKTSREPRRLLTHPLVLYSNHPAQWQLWGTQHRFLIK